MTSGGAPLGFIRGAPLVKVDSFVTTTAALVGDPALEHALAPRFGDSSIAAADAEAAKDVR